LLVDPSGLAPFRDQLAGWRDSVAGVIVNAEVRPGTVADAAVPDKDDPKRPLPWENARALLAAGHKVAIRPASDNDLDDMLYVAGPVTSGGPSAAGVPPIGTARAAHA